MKHHALQLYSYQVWANKRVFQHLKEYSNEIYTKEIHSVFPSLSEVLAHLHIVDTLWLGVMRGDSFDDIMSLVNRINEEVKNKSLEEMETMFADKAEQYKKFFDGQEDLDKVITIEHPSLGKLEACLSDLIQHVVNHGTYHRGNITAMIRQIGYPGVPTDYIFYLYDQAGKE